MDFRIIQSPSKETLDIILKRSGNEKKKDIFCTDAIGLMQGKMIDIIFAADIAEKAADVKVVDIKGICPQNMVLIGLLGDTASVESAINAIKTGLIEGSSR